MRILKKYKMWKNFDELIDYWEEEIHRLEGVKEEYYPKGRMQWFKYGIAMGRLETLKTSLNYLENLKEEDTE